MPAEWETKEMTSNDKAWADRTGPEKALFVTIQCLKVVCALALLYIFIISLGLMGNAFKIVGGPTAGQTFRNSEIFNNPFAGCCLGILATVLVQSSSTSTSIIISMTAALLIKPQNAIYMIMGANIGTSVTNTIVSLSFIGDKDSYRRAFAGATVHDCFNLLTVAILLPVEYFTHLLYHIGYGIVNSAGIDDETEKGEKMDFLKVITKPLSSRMIGVDKKLVTKVAKETDEEKLKSLMKASMIKNKRTQANFMFLDTPMSDQVAGFLLLVISLVMLTTTLILFVKLLQTIFRGRVAIWMKALLNLEIKSVPGLGDYILLLFGGGVTILFQSSSITTSTLTPLVGIGLIKLDKMFPFTVGANIGTTVTGILSALASSSIPIGLSVALAHLFFNLIGTIIWFPIPFMRAVPITMAKGLGMLAADLRWFPVAYIFIVFGIIPGLLFLLSMAHWAALVFVGLPLLLGLVGVCCVFGFRANKPSLLPAALKANPSWFPPSMRMTDPEAGKEESTAGNNTASADIESPRHWWFSPVAYGLGWYALLALLMALPNAKWADIKFHTIDKRDHVGIGAWSACGALFKENVEWAGAPLADGVAKSTELTSCMAMLQKKCTDSISTEFSTIAGANKEYEDSFYACKKVSAKDWEEKCLALTGCGANHKSMCTNITAAIVRPYQIDYSQPGTKWTAPSRDDYAYNPCIGLESLCTDVGKVKAAGNLGVAGTVFSSLGLALVIAYSVRNETTDVNKVLKGAAALLALAWVLLLASWATFASALGQDTTCYIQDDQNDGIVAAKGKFGDIINDSGSYTYYYVILAWVLITLVIGLVCLRISQEGKLPPPSSEAAAAKQMVDTDASKAPAPSEAP